MTPGAVCLCLCPCLITWIWCCLFYSTLLTPALPLPPYPTPAEDRALLPLPNCKPLVFASLLLPNHIERILLSTYYLPHLYTPLPLPLNLTMVVVRPTEDLLSWCTDHQNGSKLPKLTMNEQKLTFHSFTLENWKPIIIKLLSIFFDGFWGVGWRVGGAVGCHLEGTKGAK